MWGRGDRPAAAAAAAAAAASVLDQVTTGGLRTGTRGRTVTTRKCWNKKDSFRKEREKKVSKSRDKLAPSKNTNDSDSVSSRIVD